MKKLFNISKLAMYVCMYVCSMTQMAQAQMPAMHPEHILPTYIGVGSPVHTPIKTSAHSHPKVEFDTSGFGTIVPQDLYAYTWNGGNFVNAGIAWIRRDPATNAILNQGYINVPTSKINMEVGILQAPDMKVYVVVSYGAVAAVDFYLWTPSGLSPTPTFTQIVRFEHPAFGLASHSSTKSISMDCVGLRQIALVWEEAPKYMITGSSALPTNWNGGIYAKAGFMMSATPPFVNWGASVKIEDTDSSFHNPDIAINMDENTVRIVTVDTIPTFPSSINVNVAHTSFTTLATLPFAAASAEFPFTVDASLSGASSYDIFDNYPRIDCPDMAAGGDWWTIVFNRNSTNLRLYTRSPMGLLTANVDVDAGLSTTNCNPVVSYAPNAEFINVGWYNAALNQYVATRYQLDGSTFIPPPTPFNYYLISNTINNASCYNGSKLAFCTQQSHTDRGQFIAYPMIDMSPHLYGDMRTKVVGWNPTIPFSASTRPDKEYIKLFPNPFNQHVNIEYSLLEESSSIQYAITDMLGRQIGTYTLSSIHQLEKHINQELAKLVAGIYHINIQTTTSIHSFTMTKTP